MRRVVLEDDAALCDLVYDRARGAFIAIAAEMICAQRVYDEQQHIRLALFGLLATACEESEREATEGGEGAHHETCSLALAVAEVAWLRVLPELSEASFEAQVKSDEAADERDD